MDTGKEGRGRSSGYKSKVILMADDDLDDCDMVAEVFGDHGLPSVKIMFVHDGEALLRYLQLNPPFDDGALYPRPELILLDVHMPRGDGFSVLRKIKSISALHSVPVIMFSTSRDQAGIERAYRLGAASYLIKPDNHADLAEMMCSMMDRWLGTA